MDALPRQIAQRTIDHALAFEPPDARESGAFDHHAEVRFARPIVTAVTAVLGAVVRYDQALGRQGNLKAAFDFGRDGAFCGDIHVPIYADYQLTR